MIYDKLAPSLSRQAHRDRRVRLAERRLQLQARRSRPHRAGRRVARLRPRAEAYGIDYNIVEAIDQPWKTFEGGVGPYWGMFDAARAAEVRAGPARSPIPTIGSSPASRILFGVLLSLPILAMSAVTRLASRDARGRRECRRRMVRRPCSRYWNGHYFVPGAAFALGLGVMLLMPLIVIALARIEEIAAVAFGRKPHRLDWQRPPLVPEADSAESFDPHSGL